MVDVHTHVLPGVDDGSRDMEESCALLRKAAKQGVTAVIATPHYSRKRGTEGYRELTEELQTKIQEEFPDFSVYLGQETYYHEELPEALRDGQALTMAGSRYVLVEFDPLVPYQTLFRGLRRLLSSGYIPILAHFERYACLRQEKNLEDLEGCGCKLQMNYESLQGSLFSKDLRWCRKQVQQGRVHLLGTDMHRLDYRPPEMDAAMRWLQGHVDGRVINQMVYENPRCIIKNKQMSQEKG